MLDAAGVERRQTYTVSAVARLLGICVNTVKAMCDRWEPEEIEGRDPRGVECVRTWGGHRRIPHEALVRWLAENNSWEREFGAQTEIFK